ncbi:hypothetical protein FB45DRAFT_877167 [Roridomyces roridus]|uniref:DUF6589 domain-containing protein n=1 Tax=Roridomyces roridus TaxID=1738132 RepID=A0AAD7B293_9AGAR|nr:hypothetical protein FB45DRAFT_877167 [Roridomyces roridus]
MDQQPTQTAPVKLVRLWKRLPNIVVPPADVVVAGSSRTSSSVSGSSAIPSPVSASSIPGSIAPRSTRWNKVDIVLKTYGFRSLGEFLLVLFHPRKRGEPDRRSKSHRQTVARFLQGKCKVTMADIIPLIYDHHQSRPKRSDVDQSSAAFSPSRPLAEIHYARPCLSAWATRLVGNRIHTAVDKLARTDRTDTRHRRRVRATTNGRAKNTSLVEWEDVELSMEELAALYREEDPLLWYITECAAAPRKGGEGFVKKIRPHPGIQVGAISSFIISRNRYASGDLALPLGIWLFACQAHIDVKRVFCRLGYSCSDSTVRNALKTLTEASLATLRTRVQAATAREVPAHYQHGLGKENSLNHGTACTVFELDGLHPAAFRADDHIARIIKQERQSMTVLSLYNTIDWEHLDNVWELHAIRVLVNYLPHLAALSPNISEKFRTTLSKRRLPVRKARLQPLGTNAEQQMENKGYEAGFRNFDQQTGVEPEKSDNILSWNRGDGGTHGTLMRLKQIQSTCPDVYSSFRNALSTAETWHTKATHLNSCASNHYGPASSPDPSSLSRSSNAANMKRPTDLKKCDFYPTSRSMTLIWDARILDCWRLVLGCETDLVSHFDALVTTNRLPTLHDLLRQARILRERYACQAAYDQSLDKEEQDRAESRTKFHEGSPWTRPGEQSDSDAHMSNSESSDSDSDRDDMQADTLNEASNTGLPATAASKTTTTARAGDGPKTHSEQPGFNGDRVLSNAILFLMDFGWWTELNYAIPEGDVGRVFEILKIYIFTFAGSSNQNYMRYMLDLYTLLEYEASPELKEAILNNWLLNTRGEPGKFVEGDLMQEWSNRWLSDFSKEQGADYDDPFYRKTISPNVLHFLKIKENMESGFELKQRSKVHPAPHLRSETKILLQLYKNEELHSFRSGRSMGHAVINQFDRGYQRLEDGKLAEYLKNGAEYAQLLHEMESPRSPAAAVVLRQVRAPLPVPMKTILTTQAAHKVSEAHPLLPAPRLSTVRILNVTLKPRRVLPPLDRHSALRLLHLVRLQIVFKSGTALITATNHSLVDQIWV